MRLSSEEMAEIVAGNPLDDRTTVRVNHVSPMCSGGRDCAVLSCQSGAYRFKCFRCGAWGAIRPYKAGHRGGRYPPTGPTLDGPCRADTVASGGMSGPALPPDCTTDWREWPEMPKAWLALAHVDEAQATAHGFQWSPVTERLYYPIKVDGRPVGWQVRGFNPKYSRYWPIEPGRYGYAPNKGSRHLVVVEDWISALRVSEHANALALLGTEVPHPTLSWIVAHRHRWDCAAVYLDGDNPTVRMKARNIARLLPFRDKRVVETGADPKHESPEALRQILGVLDETP